MFSSTPSRAFRLHLAAWLSFLAVLSALWAPVSLMAQEVRSGQLGGLCRAQDAAVPVLGADLPAAPGEPHTPHCTLCSTPSLDWPLLAFEAPPRVALASALPAGAKVDRPGRRLGLPVSRGPPATTAG